MKRLLFIYLWLSGSRNKLGRWFSGRSLEEVHERRVTTGKAWKEFCHQLGIAGNVLFTGGSPMDPFQQAEGIRYLSRVTRAGLEAFLEYGDPHFPVLRRMVHETVKMGADNPDNYYLNAQISGNLEYRIVGKRNTVDHISFHTQNGNYGTTGGLAPCGKIDDHELNIDEDGSFEIILSRESRGGNWLKMEAETGMLLVRQTFADRVNEKPAELEINCTTAPTRPGPLTPEKLDQGLQQASLLVGGAPLLFTRWAKEFKEHVNTLPLFDPVKSTAAGGDESIIYYHSYWQVNEDQALVIEVKPPRCDTWNFQLNNHWMESLDYRYFNISINKTEAVTGPDGMVRIIIAHSNPGLPNWIETAHHSEGTMCWRWYRIHEGSKPVEPQCKLMELRELEDI